MKKYMRYPGFLSHAVSGVFFSVAANRRRRTVTTRGRAAMDHASGPMNGEDIMKQDGCS